MNLKSRMQTDSQFQIAPLIDVVFILLVFFIATYAAVQEEKLLDVKLPEATTAKPERRTLREVVINLDAKGGVFINRKQVQSNEVLERRLARLVEFAATDNGGEPGVIIRADGRCEHKHIVRVMDVCARAKIRRVFFGAVPADDGK